ncbi:DUF1489 domain-containing protein [Parvularcula sp. LCG005]|uniref:DUF1489 family protein n=1 Tax=Parvularcula sp. LCG005 TaxID=3078805 RepID=UPI002941D82E|nr:DUF1489 domain-containing protein [Parvularcula sp. LCG005]WOI54106.1 DUF1489 domain-containing protein [Parvularcula sp. LCG005]
MTVHLMKLSVGVQNADDLRRRHRSMMASQPSMAGPWHITRMFPRRAEEVLDGGSLYWVISGVFAVRQKIIGLEPVTTADGISRCQILLAPEWVTVDPLPRRAFQGWRYLTPEDAPADMGTDKADSQQLYRALSELGLL